VVTAGDGAVVPAGGEGTIAACAAVTGRAKPIDPRNVEAKKQRRPTSGRNLDMLALLWLSGKG